MKLLFEGYRYADAVLEHPTFRESKTQVMEILRNAPVPLLDPENYNPKSGGVKRRSRKPLKGKPAERYFFLPVDQKVLNSYLDTQFRKLKGWELQPLIVGEEKTKSGLKTKLKGDYKKGTLQIEVQFGNMARWYTDVFKFQLSYSLEEIDVAILVVPTAKFANLIDENVACYERVKRELPWAKMSLTLPILVIGIEPDDFKPIKKVYDRAFEVLKKNKTKPVAKIPFEDRVSDISLLDAEIDDV
ncbi:MAG: hypothetical protein GY861_23160 [bacterium]|nr:hypothetical protein [bacterium]